jgi:uncharacterized membrane protein
MNDPVVLQLRQAMSAHGEALLQNPAQLEQLLAGPAASFPGKVKALLILLDKKAVAFLTNWSKDARPDKGSYEQVRQQVAAKFEQAKLLNAAAAAWGLDAWAAALGLRPEGGPAQPAGAPKAAELSLAAPEPAPAAPKPPAPVAAVAASTTAATAAQARPVASTPANPYAPPAAPVSDPAQEADESAFLPGGRGVPAGRGWSWIAEGWALFKESPLIWIVIFILFMFILIAVQLVPLLGGIAGMLLAPMLGAGLMIGARAVHQGEALEVGHLFAGFREGTGTLAVVGLLYLAGTAVIVLAMVMLMGVGILGAMGGASMQALGLGVVLGILVAAALSIPLVMAYWFAPALVALNGYSAFEAMKTSFSVCVKNALPFLVYGLVGMVLGLIATIPLGLGWFVLAPVGIASMYASYRDIFYDE